MVVWPSQVGLGKRIGGQNFVEDVVQAVKVIGKVGNQRLLDPE